MFVQTLVGNAAGTLIDVSQWIESIDPGRSSDPADVTTFAAGGGPVTSNIIRGAATGDFDINALYDPTFAKIVRQIIAARNGFVLQIKAGANNLPGQADELFTGTMVMLQYALTYNAGQVSTLKCSVKPCDGGAIAPTFASI